MRRFRQRQLAEYAWLGLCGYIFAVDLALIATGKKSMTEIWEEALRHPIKRWGVILAWGFTTKHLFLRDIFPEVDPFHVIGGAAAVLQKFIIKSGDKNGHGKYGLLEPIAIHDSAFGSGIGDQGSNIVGS